MERADAEMMETEMAAQPELASNLGENKVVRDFLALARQLINQGKPSQALQAIETAAVDQLASLFTECAIAEADPVTIELSANNMAGPSTTPDAHRASILAETGRMQVVLDAVSDGSSFICLKCGGLVSNHRKEEHYAYWCC
ncbi:hypothetical protein L6164_024633 [Bauhinia variegata]|uniref:Uncharacterized protein n=1 Tax=Bauhinia variegata TaxID=167791 RepID=A0ACB9LY55_BAUVA|nr:hypothetical protein L6164_024633 [Bauhinia variegata]